MVARIGQQTLLNLAGWYPAIALTGPRQSGKTTLARTAFPDKPYISLEDPDHRLLASEDPRGFLGQFPDGAILDEVQRVPSLFSWLQGILDRDRRMGQFILTGSQQFAEWVPHSSSAILYGGDTDQPRTSTPVYSWRSFLKWTEVTFN